MGFGFEQPKRTCLKYIRFQFQAKATQHICHNVFVYGDSALYSLLCVLNSFIKCASALPGCNNRI